MIVHVLTDEVDDIKKGIATSLRQCPYGIGVVVQQGDLRIGQVFADELQRRRTAHLYQRDSRS